MCVHMYIDYTFRILLGDSFSFTAGISANFFCKGPEGKHFGLHAAQSLWQLLNSALGVSVFQ